MFVDFIMFLLQQCVNYISGIAADNTNLTVSIESFNSAIYGWTEIVLTNVMMPVATIILALFGLLELHRQALRMESAGGSLPAELIFKVLFRFVIAKMALDSILLIMKAIYGVTTYLTSQMQEYFSAVGGTVSPFDMDMIRSSVDGQGLGGQIGIFIMVLLVFLVTWIATIIANILVSVRFIELYIYTAVSPVPAATFLSDEYSQIGKGFLKSFAGTCLQGTLMYLVLTFFPVLMSGAMQNTGDIFGALTCCLLYSIVLVISIFSTGKWAKAVVGA